MYTERSARNQDILDEPSINTASTRICPTEASNSQHWESTEPSQINKNEQRNCQTVGQKGATYLPITWQLVVEYYDNDCDDDDDDEVTEHPHHHPPT